MSGRNGRGRHRTMPHSSRVDERVVTHDWPRGSSSNRLSRPEECYVQSQYVHPKHPPDQEYCDHGPRDVNDPVANCFRLPKVEHWAMVAGIASLPRSRSKTHRSKTGRTTRRIPATILNSRGCPVPSSAWAGMLPGRYFISQTFRQCAFGRVNEHKRLIAAMIECVSRAPKNSPLPRQDRYRLRKKTTSVFRSNGRAAFRFRSGYH